MSEQRLKLAVIVASVREGRFGPVVADWFLGRARHHDGFELDVIDLADVPLPHTLPADLRHLSLLENRPPELAAVGERLAAADAFVIVTPEYNRGVPAALKHFLDWHYAPWRAKAVGFVSYGAISGGLRAVEQLRLVFGELRAVTVRDSVSFPECWNRFGPDGLPLDRPGSEGAAKVMLDDLAWWATALRTAREATPYAPDLP
ncbi:NADPH-dependent FMN reductase [Bailinhaonella thermotolerans]|uniref:NADPH-dependent oxidoreductase n=1 Tax=Bailinhaonella thermotolerans TaxID=1070861 RepID=A0A3A4B0A1_9ACTN|nr:NAD(P)H-dependent oxidoreductase [Bailinhaonella thermotolerans]RJL36087.1 NADPH-dependent oxidoreductase [Bailinhaonella thermotolerans]